MGGVYVMGYPVSVWDLSKRSEAEEKEMSLASLL